MVAVTELKEERYWWRWRRNGTKPVHVDTVQCLHITTEGTLRDLPLVSMGSRRVRSASITALRV